VPYICVIRLNQNKELALASSSEHMLFMFSKLEATILYAFKVSIRLDLAVKAILETREAG
jgi:hypothetical protein